MNTRGTFRVVRTNDDDDFNIADDSYYDNVYELAMDVDADAEMKEPVMPRRSALQLIEHMLRYKDRYRCAQHQPSAQLFTTTEIDARPACSTTHKKAVERLEIERQSPLGIVFDLWKRPLNNDGVLLVCQCMTPIPGAHWTTMGQNVDPDEADIMCSTSVIDALYPLLCAGRIPTQTTNPTWILVRNVDVFRRTESARLLTLHDTEWAKCAILFVPHTSGRLEQQVVRRAMKLADLHGFQHVIFPLGCWLRQKANPLELMHMFARATDEPSSVQTIVAACPPENENQALTMRSVLLSRRAGREEAAKIAAAASSSVNRPTNDSKMVVDEAGVVFVKTLRRRFLTLNVRKSETVAMLKKNIAKVEGMSSDAFHVLSGNKVMDDTKTLSELGLWPNATLCMFRRKRGPRPNEHKM